MTEAIFSLPLYIITPVALIGYSIACLGVGLLLLKLLARQIEQVERVSAGTILATGFILGQGVLASLWLFLALAGWFSIEVVGILCFLFAVAGLYLGRGLFSRLQTQMGSIWHELREDTWGWQLIAGLTVVLCLLWFTSLARPLAGDGVAFYLVLGKIIAYSHRLIPMPGYETYTNIGLQGELHFAALMVLHSPEAAKLFSWPTISMAGIMLAALGRIAGMGRRGQWLTLSILFSSSALIWLSGWGKVDLFATPLGLAACYWAVQFRFARTKMALFLTGLFSGFSIVAKLSYAPVMVPTIGLLVLWGYETEFRNKSQWRSALRSFVSGSMVILAGLILALLPHLVKNGLLFHNPIAPIGSDGIGWLEQNWFGPVVTRRIVFTYPLALTYGSYFAQGGNLSPLILAFLPLAFYLPRPRSLLNSPLAMITLAGLTGTIVWVLYTPSVLAPRYILAVLLLLVLLPARSAEYISLHDQKPRLLAWAVIVATVVSLSAVGLYFLNHVFFPNGTIQYLTRTIDECDRDGEYCKALAAINRRAGPGERVYSANYYRYWLRPDLLQCVSASDDYAQDWLTLYQQGFRYLVVDRSTHGVVLENLEMQSPPAWLELKLLHAGERLTVYELIYNEPPTSPLRTCRQTKPRAWDVVDR